MSAPTVVAQPTLVERLVNLLQMEPALVTTFLGAAAALVAGFGVNVSQVQEAAIVTIASGVIAVVTASLAKPVRYSVITGAVVTGLTAAAAFGLKIPAGDLSLLSSALGMFLPGIIARFHLTPNAALPRGMNAH